MLQNLERIDMPKEEKPITIRLQRGPGNGMILTYPQWVPAIPVLNPQWECHSYRLEEEPGSDGVYTANWDTDPGESD